MSKVTQMVVSWSELQEGVAVPLNCACEIRVQGPGGGLFELQVVDEQGRALAGLPVAAQTSAGTLRRQTDGDGRVRFTLDEPGPISAAVADAAALAAILAQRVAPELATAPFPDSAANHLRLAGQASEPVALPAGEPQRLMVVSRLQVTHASRSRSWPALRLVEEGPWLLQTGEQTRIDLCADGAGRVLQVLSAPGSPPPAAGEGRGAGAEPGQPTMEWLSMAADEVYAALFGHQLEQVLGFLRSIPVAWPPAQAQEQQPPPGPVAEEPAEPDVEPGDIFPERNDRSGAR